jgi:hypothetical protein
MDEDLDGPAPLVAKGLELFSGEPCVDHAARGDPSRWRRSRLGAAPLGQEASQRRAQEAGAGSMGTRPTASVIVHAAENKRALAPAATAGTRRPRAT